MNEVNGESKSAVMKTFAVLGFVVLVVLGAWLAIKIVTMIPSAFSSLASLADSIHNPAQKDLAIETDAANSTLNTQESFTIAWSDMKRPGVYTLNYQCVEGAALSVRLPDGSIEDVTCDTSFVMPADTFSIDAAFSSEKTRFTEIPYTVAFTTEGDTEPFAQSEKTLTIVNPSIPTGNVAIEDFIENASVVEIGVPAPSIPIVGIDTGLRDEAVAPVAPKTTYVEVPTLEVPVSDVNGYTELETSFIKDGAISGIEGFQFKVKNTGTKDSGTWNFAATLPGGTVYTDTQEPLKVNEHIIITIGFDNDSNGTYTVVVTGGNDTNLTNNSFTRVAHN